MSEFMSEEQKKALEELKKQKPLDIKVSVSSEEMERLLNEKKELEAKLAESEAEKEDLEEKQKLIATLEFERKKKALGISPEISEKITTFEQLEGYELSQNKGSAGTVPLHSENQEGFSSYEEMIDHLRNMENTGTPEEKKEASEVLNKLTEKAISGSQEAKRGFSYESQEPLVKQINEKERQKQLKRLKQRKGED